ATVAGWVGNGTGAASGAKVTKADCATSSGRQWWTEAGDGRMENTSNARPPRHPKPIALARRTNVCIRIEPSHEGGGSGRTFGPRRNSSGIPWLGWPVHHSVALSLVV